MPATVKCPKCGNLHFAFLANCSKCGAALHEGGTDKPPHDREDQLSRITETLLPDETAEAVFDMKGGGTGFIGITTKRVIFYDKVFLRKMKALVSVPYSRINSVATQDERGLLTGGGFFASSKLILTTFQGELEFEFRGADKAHIAHDLIISHMVG